jgi:hypothetical protein
LVRNSRSVGSAIFAQKRASPSLDSPIRIGTLALDETQQIRTVLRTVGEGINASELVDIEVVNLSAGLLDTSVALEAKLLGSTGESRDIQMIAERVLARADAYWCRPDRKRRGF